MRLALLAASLAVAVVVVCATGPALAAAGVTALEPAAVAAALERGEPLLLVDVRAPQVFELRHLGGALNIPAFAIDAKRLPADRLIVVYDDGVGTADAARAAAALVAKGYPRVAILAGGLNAWEIADQPLVAPAGPTPMPLAAPIAPEALQRVLDNGQRVLLLDVRPPALSKSGRLAKAKAVAPGTPITTAAAAVAKTDLVVVYDDGSGAAQAQAEELRRAGYKSVRYLIGGTLLWNHFQKTRGTAAATTAP